MEALPWESREFSLSSTDGSFPWPHFCYRPPGSLPHVLIFEATLQRLQIFHYSILYCLMSLLPFSFFFFTFPSLLLFPLGILAEAAIISFTFSYFLVKGRCDCFTCMAYIPIFRILQQSFQECCRVFDTLNMWRKSVTKISGKDSTCSTPL